MKRVWATREGLVGHTTASGHLIQHDSWFCALPDRRALRRIVRLCPDVSGHPTNQFITLPVLEVGPHNTADTAYVFGNEQPLAEQGISIVNGLQRSAANPAGIDLSDFVFMVALGFKDNGYVWWEFVG